MNNVFYNGACAGFYRGDVRLLFDDIAILAPTIFISVPRLWNRLFDKVRFPHYILLIGAVFID